jgi:hypothetical protein
MKKSRLSVLILMLLLSTLLLSGCSDITPSEYEGYDSFANIQKYLWKFKEGVLLPNKKIHIWPSLSGISRGSAEENIFFISNFSEEEFFDLIEQLALEKSPDLFEFWPDAFYYENIKDVLYFNGWDVTTTPNEYTYYGENPAKQIDMVARYENDKAFFRTNAKVKLVVDNTMTWTGETKVIDRE